MRNRDEICTRQGPTGKHRADGAEQAEQLSVLCQVLKPIQLQGRRRLRG